MCETLPKASELITPFKYFELAKSKPSITEPDNPQKSENLEKVDYSRESDRLVTFANWKSNVVKPEDLAKAGFYFLDRPNSPDLVKCAFCHAEICNWEDGDVAMDEHIKWSPNCPFVREHSIVPRNLSFLRSPGGQDVCGNAELFTNSMPENQIFPLLRSNIVGKPYDDEKDRLETFSIWPGELKQEPKALAEAGFYYRGVEDHTICFSCQGALKDWKDDDVPWEQHAMWFPNCKFLLSKKGLAYVEEVQRKFKSEVPVNTTLTKENSETEEKQNVCENSAEGIVLCKICNSNERNVIFRPCNHILACDKCAKQISNCPVCRKKIDERMKGFLC